MVRRIASFVLLVGLSLTSPIASARDVPDQPGPWRVGHTERSAIDAARGGRVLELDLWYPAGVVAPDASPAFYSLLGALGITSAGGFENAPVADAGSYPLIVFSHGFGSINTQSFHLMEHLASHGFFVIALEHTGNKVPRHLPV